jgi:predicted nuclease with RNAse H fold
MSAKAYIGIDPTAGRKPMNYAVLDDGLRPAQGTGSQAEVLQTVLAHPTAVVAVDAPQSPSRGLMTSAEYRARLSPAPAAGRWGGFKVCEYELKRRGIGLYVTPTDAALAPNWMRTGFELYAALRAAGYETYAPGSSAARQVLEVHPHACFTVLLGRLPLPKQTLEGRLQRQLVLYRAGVEVVNPMDALEELTAQHVLEGRVAMPGLLDHDALDALAAAYTAYLAAEEPDQVTLVGDPEEGQIALPIAAEELKDSYRVSPAPRAAPLPPA